jgi:hypothetical protein
MSSKLFGAVGAALLTAFCAGCAGMATDQAEPHQEKIYRTGSNIPQKDRASPEVINVDPSAISDQRRARGMPGGPTGR